jgi:predicted house-cleaning noncanonical NTP pyrophosphatase (MazG superfamily)
MKLVRDRIPVLYPQHTYHLAGPAERSVMLRLKLAEEVGEVLSAPTDEALLEELADVYEVLETLAADRGWSLEGSVRAARDAKRAERGGFAEGWVLE